MEVIEKIEKELNQYSSKETKEKCEYFHKTDEGGYAFSDVFLGITVPNIRIVAKKYANEIMLEELEQLLHSKYHEYRLTALLILTYKMKKATKEQKEEIVKFYLNNTEYINGWDLVDLSAHYILGQYLLEENKERKILYRLAKSDNMWEQRISIVSTWIFIRNGQFEDTLEISKILLNNPNDLIHKAVGWMLREVGKKNYDLEYEFLIKYYKQMPRTMLRYAIEKFEEKTRKAFLSSRKVHF